MPRAAARGPRADVQEDEDADHGLSDGGPGLCCLRLGSVAFGLVACFIVLRALAYGKAFDATVAAFLLVLCCWIYRLQGERQALRDKLGVLVPEFLGGRRQAPQASAQHALDLTTHAHSLGLSLRTGTLVEGTALSKILLSALAKEHLSLVAALRLYQDKYGPLPEGKSLDDSVASTVDVTGASVTTFAARIAQVASPARLAQVASPARRRSQRSLETADLDMSQRSNLGAELAEFANAARTPRSPQGPPSPAQHGRSRSFGNAVTPRTSATPPPSMQRAATHEGTTPGAQPLSSEVLAGAVQVQVPSAYSFTGPSGGPATVLAPSLQSQPSSFGLFGS